jgi:hypothetical protein
MKRLFGLAALLLGSTCAAQAQSLAPALSNEKSNLPADPETSITGTTAFEPLFPWEELFPAVPLPVTVVAVPDAPLSSAPETADPAPASPKPKFVFGGRDDYRWQLSLGVDWIRFRSSIFNASAVGFHTSATYYTNSWFGFEGSISAAYAPTIFQAEHVKVLLYGGGPKIAWRQRQWEPWLHAIVGGAHEQPQTQKGSRNAFGLQTGGGADYRFNPRFSGRLQADYVYTTFWSQSQNSFQLSAGLVIHF